MAISDVLSEAQAEINEYLQSGYEDNWLRSEIENLTTDMRRVQSLLDFPFPELLDKPDVAETLRNQPERTEEVLREIADSMKAEHVG